jgi:hypothetical protein
MHNMAHKLKCLALIALAATVSVAIVPAPALAYIGPGAGVSLFGAAIGLVIAIFTAIGIVLLWPIRALLRLIRGTLARTEKSDQTERSKEAQTT